MSCENLNQLSGQLVFGGTNLDAFGRLRVSEPFTLFDSQNRYAIDDQFSSSTTGTGSNVSFVTNESSTSLNVGTVSGGKTVRQTFRRMPYQPGKSLLTLATFLMNTAKANLRQRVGYFDENNGIFLEQNGTSCTSIYNKNKYFRYTIRCKYSISVFMEWR
jgi:hypothetical protein